MRKRGQTTHLWRPQKLPLSEDDGLSFWPSSGTGKAIFSVLSDHNVIPPYGVLGGYWGAPNTFTVIRDGKEFQPAPYPGKLSGFELREGDIVVERSSGGGGYGDPLLRDPDRVYRDVTFGYITSQNYSIGFSIQIGNRDGGEQRLGIRVPGADVYIPVGGHLDYFTQIHDGNSVTDILHHCQIMGDDDIGQVELILQVDQKIDNLGLDGNIQGGDGFIADNDLGV